MQLDDFCTRIMFCLCREILSTTYKRPNYQKDGFAVVICEESVPWRGRAQVGSLCLAVSLAHDGFAYECAVVGDFGDDVGVADCD